MYINDFYGFISMHRGLAEREMRKSRVKLTFYHLSLGILLIQKHIMSFTINLRSAGFVREGAQRG